MTMTATMLTAFLAIQSGATVQEPTLQEGSDATPTISLPEESTGTATQPIAESTWQDTEIELLMRKARESLQEDRYPEALDRRRGASELVDDNQRVFSSVGDYRRHVEHLRHEAARPAREIVAMHESGKNSVHGKDRRVRSRHKASDVREHSNQGARDGICGLATGGGRGNRCLQDQTDDNGDTKFRKR